MRALSSVTIAVMLALLFGSSASASPTGRGAQQLPFLSVKQSKKLIRKVLRQDFGRRYTRGHARYVDSCTRKPKLKRRPGRVRCAVGWRYKNFSYEGDAAIWLRWRDGSVRWWYAYSIAETDKQCLDDGGTYDECVYVYDV